MHLVAGAIRPAGPTNGAVSNPSAVRVNRVEFRFGGWCKGCGFGSSGAGESAGVQMPFGCRMGICQSYVIGLVEGHVRDLRTGAEHNREPGANMHFRRFRRLRVGRLDFTRQ
jgi:hypothetical protein